MGFEEVNQLDAKVLHRQLCKQSEVAVDVLYAKVLYWQLCKQSDVAVDIANMVSEFVLGKISDFG